MDAVDIFKNDAITGTPVELGKQGEQNVTRLRVEFPAEIGDGLNPLELRFRLAFSYSDGTAFISPAIYPFGQDIPSIEYLVERDCLRAAGNGQMEIYGINTLNEQVWKSDTIQIAVAVEVAVTDEGIPPLPEWVVQLQNLQDGVETQLDAMAALQTDLESKLQNGMFQGEPGVGVPDGGSTGQVLAKKSGASYDTEWADAADNVADNAIIAALMDGHIDLAAVRLESTGVNVDKDAVRVNNDVGMRRVVMGKVDPETGVYGMEVYGQDGTTVLFNIAGITRDGIPVDAIDMTKFDNTVVAFLNGLNRAFFQSEEPAADGLHVGDVWYDTDNGYKMASWDGSAWANRLIGGSAIAAETITGENIAAETITGGKIAAGEIDALHIKANAITADAIAAEAITTEHIAAEGISASKIKGDTLTLGGAGNLNGSMSTQTADGAEFAKLDNAGFVLKDPTGNARLVDRLNGTTPERAAYDSANRKRYALTPTGLQFYTTTGEASKALQATIENESVTVGAGKPFISPNAYLASLATIVDHDIDIAADAGSYASITLDGFSGSGTITIRCPSGTASVPYIKIRNCHLRKIVIRNFNVTTITATGIECINSDILDIQDVTITSADNKQHFGVYMECCSGEFDGVISNRATAIHVINGSSMRLLGAGSIANCNIGVTCGNASIVDTDGIPMSSTTEQFRSTGGLITSSTFDGAIYRSHVDADAYSVGGFLPDRLMRVGLGTRLENYNSLDSLLALGDYYSPDAATSATISNTPVTDIGFKVSTECMQSTGFLRQTLLSRSDMHVRYYTGSVWTSWLRFLSVYPLTRPAYTQTYSTANRDIAAQQAEPLTDGSGGTASTTLSAITAGSSYSQTDMQRVKNALASITAQYHKLRNDHLDTLQALNSLINDLRTVGIIAPNP